jgi:hypothetical protein
MTRIRTNIREEALHSGEGVASSNLCSHFSVINFSVHPRRRSREDAEEHERGENPRSARIRVIRGLPFFLLVVAEGRSDS